MVDARGRHAEADDAVDVLHGLGRERHGLPQRADLFAELDLGRDEVGEGGLYVDLVADGDAGAHDARVDGEARRAGGGARALDVVGLVEHGLGLEQREADLGQFDLVQLGRGDDVGTRAAKVDVICNAAYCDGGKRGLYDGLAVGEHDRKQQRGERLALDHALAVIHRDGVDLGVAVGVDAARFLEEHL